MTGRQPVPVSRTERLLALANSRGDRVAVATLETWSLWLARVAANDRRLAVQLATDYLVGASRQANPALTESEARAMWGDR